MIFSAKLVNKSAFSRYLSCQLVKKRVADNHRISLLFVKCMAIEMKHGFHFLFWIWQRIMPSKFLLNGFSALDCMTKRITHCLFSWAEPPAHFLLHALMLSPILRAWHSNFRNTGLTPWQCAHGVRIPYPYPSQLKD
ncbi:MULTISPECIES: protein YnhH [unclassified Klebsiella]|uniref:protein YnhH n=1 Tax=unclassified Klebsiella TaxID=2608929 RepID=UPI003FA3C611